MDKTFSKTELAKFDGLDGRPAYIAFHGWVFDVSGSTLWLEGRHQALHNAGEDLSAAINKAPHGASLLARVPRMGRLV